MEKRSEVLTETSMDDLERELVDLCVRIAQFVALPKSIGEIYGIIFISAKPIRMEQIVENYAISKGSVSQGLRTLKALGAVRSQYVPQDRRDYYVAETGLGQLVAGIMRTRFEPAVIDFGERVRAVNESYQQTEGEHHHLAKRIEKLKHWQGQVESVVPTLTQLLSKGVDTPR